MMYRYTIWVCLAVLLGSAGAFAAGHGPVFGLATPTLGKGGWSLDVAVMDRIADGKQSAMLRAMLGYGITEDFQISASLPMPLHTRTDLPQVRVMAMMPGAPDIEFLLGWRFHRQGIEVGARFESTTYIGFNYPTDAFRNGIQTWPGLYLAAVTGYASRTVYFWVGGLYRRYMRPAGSPTDYLGDLSMYSLVFGYRPRYFQKDYPHPDWRLFVEVIGEHSARNQRAGMGVADSGGHQVFAGPSLLGLYGPWGISFGTLFPLYRNLNGTQVKENVRAVVNYTCWF